jgi:hypothetical protein
VRPPTAQPAASSQELVPAATNQLIEKREESMKPTAKPVKKGKSQDAKKLEKKTTLANIKPLVRVM